MNIIQFAVASIVDANTGHGLVHDAERSDSTPLANRGRLAGSGSAAALLRRVGAGLSALIASLRERRAQKQNLRRLAQLNDHLLEDIGLSRGDVIALQLGQVDVKQLEAKRYAKRTLNRVRGSGATSNVGKGIARNAFNEAVFARAKCA